MTASSMVLYRPQPSSALTSTSHNSSLISSRLFTAQTGTAIATELLYRILMEIVSRVMNSVQRFASARMDQFSTYLEQRAAERQQKMFDAAQMRQESRENGPGIVDEVGKLVEERGFECPMTGVTTTMGANRVGPRPPRWVRGVLEGVEEGRMEEKDFWINTHIG